MSDKYLNAAGVEVITDYIKDIKDVTITKKNQGLAICATAAATAAKDGVVSGDFDLRAGSAVDMIFYYGNTAASPTMNINDTGAKPILQYTGTEAGSTNSRSWKAGEVVRLVYNGTSWVMEKHFPDTATTTEAGLMSAADKTKLDGTGNIIGLSYTVVSTF